MSGFATTLSKMRENDRLDEAESACREIIAKEPRLALAWRALALIARKKGDHAAALAHFKAAAEIDPAHFWTLQDVAAELRELGRMDEAEALLRSLVDKRP